MTILAFTRPIDILGALIQDSLGMTHRALAAMARASVNYLKQQSLPARLAALGLPVLVIFGADDHRWRSSSAAAYRVVPGAPRRAAARRGTPPDAGRPQTTRHIAAGLHRSRRAPQLTVPSYRRQPRRPRNQRRRR